MKQERIFRALTNIKEEYIPEAAPPARPRRQWWKAGVGLAACLCLVVVAAMTIPFGGSGGDGCCTDIPESNWAYGLAAQGDTVYFAANGNVYSHHPGDEKPTELAQFRGIFFETPHGVFCFDEYCEDDSSPDLYLANGDTLTPIANLPDDARRLTILDVTDGVVYWSSADTIWSEEEGQRIPTYQTDCATGETTLLFAAPDIQPPQRMAEGKLWFTAKGGLFQYYDMETEEIVTYCNSFWSYKAEPYTVFYFEDFILCHCIQYEPNEEGTHDAKGYWYYRLDYGSSEPVFLSEQTWHSIRPWVLDSTIYFPGYNGDDIYLMACNADTGQLTQLTQERFTPDELAVTHTGFYYVEDHDLFYFDPATGEALLLAEKKS